MRLFKNLILAALTVTSLSAAAQTADDIIAKNTEAMGGASKIAALSSVKYSGNLSAQGMDIPMTITKQHMKGMRLDIEVMGTSNYQIITPEKGYIFFPIQQMSEVTEMTPEQVLSSQSQLDVQGSLYNYKEKGTTIQYVGTEKLDGADVYKLKLTFKTGKVSQYFIDTKTNRVQKVKSIIKGADGADTEIETAFSDYKQNADGYWFAYSTTTPQGPVVYDKIETNIKVDENIFKN